MCGSDDLCLFIVPHFWIPMLLFWRDKIKAAYLVLAITHALMDSFFADGKVWIEWPHTNGCSYKVLFTTVIPHTKVFEQRQSPTCTWVTSHPTHRPHPLATTWPRLLTHWLPLLYCHCWPGEASSPVAKSECGQSPLGSTDEFASALFFNETTQSEWGRDFA